MADRTVPNADPGPSPDGRPLRAVRGEVMVRYDAEVERAVLAGVLGDGLRGWDVVETLVRPEDFYVPNNGHIFAAMRTLAAGGTNPWPAQVIDQLRRDQMLEAVGGRQAIELLGLDYKPGSYQALADDARLISAYARSRRLLAYAAEMQSAAERNDHAGALEVLRRASEEQATAEGASSWGLVDVGDVLDNGLEVPVPSLLARADGSCLLYAGKTHAFNAESESGKTWLALMLCRERIAAGEHVLYLDFEADVVSVLARARQLGIPVEGLRSQFHYIRPDDPFDLVARAKLLETLGAFEPSVAVIDGVAEVMAMNNWNEKDNFEIAAFLNALPRLLERSGCCVVMIDHLTKDKANQDRYARGGAHKLAGITGAAYKLEVVHRFAPGHNGLARVIVTKDRHGGVRALCGTSPKIAELAITSTPGEPDVAAEVRAPEWGATQDGGASEFRPTGYMERVSHALEDLPPAELPISRSSLCKLVAGKRKVVWTAIDRLVEEGHVSAEVRPKGTYLSLVRPFREADRQGPLDPDAGPDESSSEGEMPFDEEPF